MGPGRKRASGIPTCTCACGAAAGAVCLSAFACAQASLGMTFREASSQASSLHQMSFRGSPEASRRCQLNVIPREPLSLSTILGVGSFEGATEESPRSLHGSQPRVGKALPPGSPGRKRASGIPTCTCACGAAAGAGCLSAFACAQASLGMTFREASSQASSLHQMSFRGSPEASRRCHLNVIPREPLSLSTILGVGSFEGATEESPRSLQA